jgi:putative tryptophan/tyrosine transport system substrate-binding protein
MRRREFITLLGGAALATQSRAFAQGPARALRVGTLGPGPLVTDASPNGAALLRGFGQLGYTQGANLVFERRAAEGHLERLPALINELSASKVDVIITFGYPAAAAAKAHTMLPVVAIFAGDRSVPGLSKASRAPAAT